MRAAVMETSFGCGLEGHRSLGLGDGLDGRLDGGGDFINVALVVEVREVVPEAVDCADDPWCRPLQYERVEPTRALFSASIRKIQSVMAALHNQTIYNAARHIYMRHAIQ